MFQNVSMYLQKYDFSFNLSNFSINLSAFPCLKNMRCKRIRFACQKESNWKPKGLLSSSKRTPFAKTIEHG